MLTETARKSRKKQRPPIAPPPAIWMPAIVLYVLFSGLILLSARSDLWLDEIWSVDFARSAHSGRDLFVRFRHDNNHPLNTMFLYLVRQQSGFLVDRILSILCGIGTLVLCGEWTRRVWGRRESFLTILLAGSSFPLLLYFSEARGYAPAIFFALLAFVSLEQNLDVFKTRRLVGFLLASALGVLSHSTFVIATIALCVMHAVVVFKSPSDRPRRLSGFLMHQVPALLFPVVWYFLFVRHMEVGGGPVESTIHVVGQTAAYLWGLPVASPWPWIALCLAGLVMFWGTRRLKKDGRGEWIFFPVMLVLAPALVLALVRPKYLYFRYFILCFPFFYMLLGYVLGRATAVWGRSTRWMPWLIVLMLVLGQSTRVKVLVQEGRGHYAAAWARIARDTASSNVNVGSDHDFRNRLVLSFYAARDPLGKFLYYVPQTEWSQRPPDWVLVTQGQEFSEPPDEIPFKDVGIYRFVASYDAAPVSGWGWFLYRKQ